MANLDVGFYRPGLAELLRKIFGNWQGIRGVPRTLWWSRRLAFPSAPVLLETPDGLPFVMDREDYGQVMLYYFPYCQELQALIADVIDPGDACLDLGANVGLLTAHMAKCAGENGKVIAVEPNPPVCAQLKRMSEQVFPENVIVVSAGIAEKDGIGSLHLPEGRYSESVEVTETTGNGASLELLSITSLVGRYLHGSAPDFIKVDIEGNEAYLIESMSDLFGEGLRPILLVEFHPQKCEQRGVAAAHVIQRLIDLGYQARRVVQFKGNYRLSKISQELIGHDNLLFMLPTHFKDT